MTPEVAARLKEITVDPKTVTLPKKVDAASVGVAEARGRSARRPLNYKAKIETPADRTIPLTITSEIKEEGGAWDVTETAKTPMGEMGDTSWVEKGTLTIQSALSNRGLWR